jgi:predicted xylose isomerase-like sugar epimerase
VYATRLLAESIEFAARTYVMVPLFDDSERSKRVRETSMCKKEDEN